MLLSMKVDTIVRSTGEDLTYEIPNHFHKFWILSEGYQ